MKLSLYILVCTITLSAFGQATRLKKADELYELHSYALAADNYEPLLGSSSDSPALKSKLANSYFQIGDMANAERIYGMYLPGTETADEDAYRYAQTLKENGKYAESDQWMMKFASKNPQDQRSEIFVKNSGYLQKIKSEGAYFSVRSLDINTGEADFGGYPNNSGSEVYFISARRDPAFFRRIWNGNERPFLDLYKAQQPVSGELNNPNRISKNVNTIFHEGPVCFSADGNKVYYTRNNISDGEKRRDERGIQQLKLYIADVKADGSWSDEKEFQYNSREFSIGHPTIGNDGKYLYFASNMPGTIGGADLFRSEILADGKFGKPENLGAEINTEGQEMFPWIGKEGELFFASDGHTGLGGLDVFVCIPDNAGNYRKIINAGLPLNSEKDDFAFSQNPDGKTGYFSSNRSGGKGDDDIYSYAIVRPFKLSLIVKGQSKDPAGAIIPAAALKLVDGSGNIVAEAVSGKDGSYSFPVEPENDYRIEASKTDYFDNLEQFTTKNLPVNTEEITKDVALEKDPGLALYALVTDAETKAALQGVKIKIVDNITNTTFIEKLTPETGDAMKGLSGARVNDRLSYTITLEKEGYLSKMVVFNTQVKEPGIIKVQQSLDLSMQKLEVGGDLAKLIDIKPIYFDLGKYVIRPDAAKELDKIVKVMNDYPTLEIELGSHTDCRGSVASNEKLSDNRAKASAAYVQSRIQNPQRIYGKGFGESKLKNGCACEGTVKSTCSETEHQENRRTEFIITKM